VILTLKVLPSHAIGDDVAIERFTREAPHCVRPSTSQHRRHHLRDWRSEARSVIAMELVEGQTLRALIRCRPGVETLAQIGAQTARALSVAHSRGNRHADVKPENVMFDGTDS
jgi:serine/threonine-protein kinase